MDYNPSLRILFAQKLPDDNISIYGNIVPSSTIAKYKDKISVDIKNGLLVATVGDYKNMAGTSGLLKSFDNGIVLFKISGIVEDEIGYYMKLQFTDNEAAKLILEEIRYGNMATIFIKNCGEIIATEYFTDPYLEKSMTYRFFRWLRHRSAFVDIYYTKRAYHKLAKK